jgi:hypothetical protein
MAGRTRRSPRTSRRTTNLRPSLFDRSAGPRCEMKKTWSIPTPPAKIAITAYRIGLCVQSGSGFNLTDEGYFCRGFSIKPRHRCRQIDIAFATAAHRDSFCSQANEQGTRFLASISAKISLLFLVHRPPPRAPTHQSAKPVNVASLSPLASSKYAASRCPRKVKDRGDS